MPKIETSVQCDIHNSFRVQQVAGMFDLPPRAALREQFAVDVPAIDEPWRIGAIVGPSGSGKSTIARAAFGDAFYQPGGCSERWPRDRAVIDGFGDVPIQQLTRVLAAVGFGSPPSWLKPYRVLSTGEKFRCELARALLHSGIRKHSDGRPPANSAANVVVFDEFTSVVDRRVAQIASAAVAKAIRGNHVDTRLVAVSCHDDILPWLSPDWVVDMRSRTLTRHGEKRGRLRPRESQPRERQRPPIHLEIVRAKHAAWGLFARHHYLSGSLSRAAQVYLAVWNDTPVALCAVVALYGYPGRRRIHRLVTLPDFQGVGIGSRLLDHVAGLERAAGRRVNITSSHPAIIAHCRGSPAWKAVALRRSGAAARQSKDGKSIRSSRGRATVSFEFAP